MHLVHELSVHARELQQRWGLNGLGHLTDEQLRDEIDRGLREVQRAREAETDEDMYGEYTTEGDLWDEYVQELLEELTARRILHRQLDTE